MKFKKHTLHFELLFGKFCIFLGKLSVSFASECRRFTKTNDVTRNSSIRRKYLPSYNVGLYYIFLQFYNYRDKPPIGILKPPKDVFQQHPQTYQLPPKLPDTLGELLAEYNLQMYLPNFENEGIEISTFLEMVDSDLKKIGIEYVS